MSRLKGADLGLNLSALGATSYKGAWSATATYAVGDIVTRLGGLWVAWNSPGVAGAIDPATYVPGAATLAGTDGGTSSDPGFGSLFIQGFTVNTDADLKELDLQMGASSPGALVGIVAGNPSGDPATFTYLATGSIPAGTGYQRIVLNTSVHLTAGTTYSFVIRQSAQPAIWTSAQTLTGIFASVTTLRYDSLLSTVRSWSLPLRLYTIVANPWTKIGNTDPLHLSGAWSSSTSYAPNDVVSDAYSLWVALVTVPAGAGNEPSLVPTFPGPGSGTSATTSITNGNYGVDSVYQKFQVAANCTIVSVTVKWSGSGTGHFDIGIASAPGSSPSATTFLSSTTGAAKTTAGAGDVTYTFPSSVSLVIGTDYYLVLRTTDGTYSGTLGARTINYSNANPVVASGNIVLTSPNNSAYVVGATSGTWTANANTTLVFTLNATSSPYWQKIANTGNQENVGQVAASSTAVTIADPEIQSITRIVLTANCTITLPPVASGKSFKVVLVQDATGGRTVTWATTNPVLWPGGVAPTQTSTALKGDVYEFFADGSANWIGRSYGQNY